MNRKALLQYKKTSVGTISRERILLMLYDGAIRFLEQAKRAVEQGQAQTKGEKISRAHAIISELNATLNHDVAPELCNNLQSLYFFIFEQLNFANLNNDIPALNTSIELLDQLRGAWREAVKQNTATPAQQARSSSVQLSKR